MKIEEIQALDRKALVALAVEKGIEKANATKTVVLVENLNAMFNGKPLGRKIDPTSARQIKLAAIEARKAAGEVIKRGRPIESDSARQIRLAEMEAKREKGELKRGRPIDPTSPRQIKLAQMAKLRAEGLLKRGRPAAPKVEVEVKAEVESVVLPAEVPITDENEIVVIDN